VLSHSQGRIPILAYHAVLTEKRISVPQGWSARHAVDLDSFRSQLDLMRGEGWITTVPEKIEGINIESSNRYCILTFDDGHSSDLIAAETMRSRGYCGIFYVPWCHLATDGFLGPSDIKTLSEDSFVIGSHGLTHSPLTKKSDKGLREELVESKERLEDLIGRSVEDLAVPFGRYNRRVIIAAKAAGYRRIMTSDIGLARIGKVGVFPRLPVTSATTLPDFRGLVSMRPTGAVLRRLSTAARHRMESVRNAVSRTR
jgi:peptidoglycan/xylan/chitin deacetylase (PgdA/CDA1 family)